MSATREAGMLARFGHCLWIFVKNSDRRTLQVASFFLRGMDPSCPHFPIRLNPSTGPGAPDPRVSGTGLQPRASAGHSHVACPRLAWTPACSSGHCGPRPSVWHRKGSFWVNLLLRVQTMERVSRPRPAQGTRTQGTQLPHPQMCPENQLLLLTSGLLCNLKNEHRTVILSRLVKKKSLALQKWASLSQQHPFLSSSPTFVASDLPESTLTPFSGPLHCDLLNRNA